MFCEMKHEIECLTEMRQNQMMYNNRSGYPAMSGS